MVTPSEKDKRVHVPDEHQRGRDNGKRKRSVQGAAGRKGLRE